MPTPSRLGHTLSRRAAVGTGLAGLAASAIVPSTLANQPASPIAGGDVPVSGEAVPALARFDDIMVEMLSTRTIPGAQLAIARDGRLVYNRGFGYASVEDQEHVEPGSIFRIASTSKPVTAVAVLMLVDAGELALDTPVFPRLAYDRLPDAPYDSRLDTITVEHLLVHSGGWNSSLGPWYDPQYLPWPLMASHLFGTESPAEAETIVRSMLTEPLDFDPGTQSAYSNFGFNVLGRLIERVSGEPYEKFVLDNVLAPAGVTSMAIGGTTPEERLPGEVRYYSPPELEPRISVFPGEGFVPVGYGSFYLRSLDAHGGWVASAADLLRFTLAIDGAKGEALLTPATVSAMETTQRPPAAAVGAGNLEDSLGLGWNSAPQGDGYEWSHAGALEGSNASWLVRRPDGMTLAFVVNSLPTDYGSFFGATTSALQALMTMTTDWPDTDLFH